MFPVEYVQVARKHIQSQSSPKDNIQLLPSIARLPAIHTRLADPPARPIFPEKQWVNALVRVLVPAICKAQDPAHDNKPKLAAPS